MNFRQALKTKLCRTRDLLLPRPLSAQVNLQENPHD
jgi:hypothetical protein